MIGEAVSILVAARRLGITLAVYEDRLRFYPRSKMTDALLHRIIKCKAAVMNALALGDPAVSKPEATGCPTSNDRQGSRCRTHPEPVQAKIPTRATADNVVRDDAAGCNDVADESVLWPAGRPDWLDFVMSPAFDEETRYPCDPVMPNGWRRSAWIDQLKQLADRCEKLRPDLAREYRREADEIERESGNDP